MLSRLLVIAAALALPAGAISTQPAPMPETTLAGVIPAPLETHPQAGSDFRLTRFTVVRNQPGSAAAFRVGAQRASALRPATGFVLPVLPVAPKGLPAISLLLGP